MGDLSYNKRKARGRLVAEFGTQGGTHLNGISVFTPRIAMAVNRGSWIKLSYGLRVIRQWKHAVQLGIPASKVQYPTRPQEGRKLSLPPGGRWKG